MTKRTRDGLTLIYVPDSGYWITEDGKYAIGRVRALSLCDNPHPMRSGYCQGDQEHDSEIGWDVRTDDGEDAVDGALFDTLTEAHRELAAWLALGTAVGTGRPTGRHGD